MSKRPRVPFVVSDDTGHILRWGLCGDNVVVAQASEPGESSVETSYEVIESLAASSRLDRDAVWDKGTDPTMIVTPEYIAPRPFRIDLFNMTVVRIT